MLVGDTILATYAGIGTAVERARPWIGDWCRAGFVPGGIPTGPPPA